MARVPSGREDLYLVRTLLGPLAEAGAALRPGLDERMMVLTLRLPNNVSIARKTISQREIDRLLARGLIRREAPPSRYIVITLAGEQLVQSARRIMDNEADNALIEVTDAVTGDTRIVNYRESPLAWLSRRKGADKRPLIDALQFAAGERLRSDFTYAGLSPRMTLDWTRYGAGTSSGIGHPGLATEVMTAARQRLHAALDALGPDYAGLALDLCCFLKGIGDVERARGLKQRSAKHRLIVALDILVRHYGLGARGPECGQGIVAWAEGAAE